MKNIKTSLLALLVSIFFIGNTAYASFPVKSDQKNQIKTEQSAQVSESQESISNTAGHELKVQSEDINSTKGNKGGDDKLILLLLWLFLGGFAAHRWYAGKPTVINIIFILTLGGLGIWAIIDLINILTDKF